MYEKAKRTIADVRCRGSFSDRQMYLVPQYFIKKPVEHLLGVEMHAEMLCDGCLGRTLDWLYAHAPTRLFAGIASRVRQIFGIKAQQVHVDAISFSVSGQYSMASEGKVPGEGAAPSSSEAVVIAITYGYSRDHREDLKQWKIVLTTTHRGYLRQVVEQVYRGAADEINRGQEAPDLEIRAF
jgi:transposase